MKVLFITAIALMVCSVTCISFKPFEDDISQKCQSAFLAAVQKCAQDKIVPPRAYDQTIDVGLKCKLECIGLGCAETVTADDCTQAEIDMIRAGAKQEVQTLNEGECKEHQCKL